MNTATRRFRTIDDVLTSVLDRSISRGEFRRFVLDHWEARRFAFHTAEGARLAAKVAALAADAPLTHHGRPDQPVCPSRHLFGDDDSVAARLVFDAPESAETPEAIEFHTHPTESIIAVMKGSGCYQMCHRDDDGEEVVVDVPLTAGSVVCFPADVVHTIVVGADGIETLNITDRLNQPAWRDDPSRENAGPPASPDFAEAVDPPAGARTVPYAAFSPGAATSAILLAG
ncbi:MAG TPA: hypothetical protein VEL05_00410 [Candidatus Acidoferrum sp.]|nr:hypothetical protein [Candidatus Acidoferrum sp.]